MPASRTTPQRLRQQLIKQLALLAGIRFASISLKAAKSCNAAGRRCMGAISSSSGLDVRHQGLKALQLAALGSPARKF